MIRAKLCRKVDLVVPDLRIPELACLNMNHVDHLVVFLISFIPEGRVVMKTFAYWDAQIK